MMEYFDRNLYHQDYSRHTNFRDKLNVSMDLFNELQIGKFNDKVLAIFLDRNNRVDKLTAMVEKPIIEDLDRMGLKNETLRNSQMQNATIDQKRIIRELDQALKPSMNIENEAFEIRNGEVALSKDWEEDLRKRHTTIATTQNQKRFAELVEIFQNNYNELKNLLPGNTPVFANEHDAIKPLFRMKGTSISFVDHSLLQTIN